MTDYTPTTEEVREEYVYGAQEVDMAGHVVVSFEDANAWFDRWLVSVKAEALREFAGVVDSIAALGVHNSGLRTPEHLAEFVRNYASRAEGRADR